MVEEQISTLQPGEHLCWSRWIFLKELLPMQSPCQIRGKVQRGKGSRGKSLCTDHKPAPMSLHHLAVRKRSME